MHNRIPVRSAALLAVLALGAAPAQAQEAERELGWFDVGELTFLWTAGNAETATFGFKNTLDRVWERSSARLEFGAIRTESTLKTRTAVGPSTDDFEVSEQERSEKTVENYYVKGRYDRSLSERFFVFGEASWDRNKFAGIDNRYTLVAGAGNTWLDGETAKFRTNYGVTYTFQDDVVDDPTKPDGFIGLRLSYDYLRALTSTTEFVSELIVDDSFDELEDLRANFYNGIAVAISDRLALKTGVRLLFDNLPALVGLPLEFPAGTPTGDTVTTELDKLDTIVSVALVVNF